ncbi:MAG: hypothetical protein GQF41_4105 [Candidatus Rifleibacterium amylolyticum]|nr:MAG: hypothetical protein GQF41_4105 [Candidatus Rifleibacterium amylolyticum]
MILISGDVHSQYHVINEQIRHAETVMNRELDAVIVLGDFGIYEQPLHQFFDKEGGHFLRKLYFIDGNHEEFAQFDHLIEKYSHSLNHLSRGKVTQICNRRFLSLGGARYMDALNSPSGSEIRDCDIAHCLAHRADEVDFIITHDCPAGIGVPNAPGMEFYGKPGFERGSELIEHFKPKKWFFAHYHRWFSRKIGESEFFGLPESWKGFGLLDEQGNYQAVEHAVEKREDWLQRFIKKLFSL